MNQRYLVGGCVFFFLLLFWLNSPPAEKNKNEDQRYLSLERQLREQSVTLDLRLREIEEKTEELHVKDKQLRQSEQELRQTKESYQQLTKQMQQMKGSGGGGKPSSATQEEDPNLLYAYRQVYWKNGAPLMIPSSVHRIDSYEIHFPGEEMDLLHYAWWTHPCEKHITFDPTRSANFFNPQNVGNWKKYVRPGSVAIDVGCWAGDSTVPIALNARMTIGFEPNPKVFEVLKINSEINPGLNIKPHQLAVGKRNAKDSWGYGCNGGAKDRSSNELFDVTIVKLYDFLVENYPRDVIADISFIKTDTEGFDVDILETLDPLFKLTTTRPIIKIEWFGPDRDNEQKNAHMLKVINAMDYVIFDPEGKVRVYNPVTHWPKYPDLILYPREVAILEGLILRDAQ